MGLSLCLVELLAKAVIFMLEVSDATMQVGRTTTIRPSANRRKGRDVIDMRHRATPSCQGSREPVPNISRRDGRQERKEPSQPT